MFWHQKKLISQKRQGWQLFGIFRTLIMSCWPGYRELYGFNCSIAILQFILNFVNHLRFEKMGTNFYKLYMYYGQARGQVPVQSPSQLHSKKEGKGNLASGMSLKSHEPSPTTPTHPPYIFLRVWNECLIDVMYFMSGYTFRSWLIYL